MTRLGFALATAIAAFRGGWRIYPRIDRSVIIQGHTEEPAARHATKVNDDCRIIDTPVGVAFSVPQKMRGRFVAGGKA